MTATPFADGYLADGEVSARPESKTTATNYQAPTERGPQAFPQPSPPHSLPQINKTPTTRAATPFG